MHCAVGLENFRPPLRGAAVAGSAGSDGTAERLQAPLGGLAGLPNVTLVGQVPHDQIAGHIERFDVGIVPYRLGEQTDTVFPTKLHEYLAMGKPVVSSALPEVCDFNARHGVVQTPRNDPGEFLAAIDSELTRPGNEKPAARRAVAESYAWDPQLERISELIEAARPGDGPARLARA